MFYPNGKSLHALFYVLKLVIVPSLTIKKMKYVKYEVLLFLVIAYNFVLLGGSS